MRPIRPAREILWGGVLALALMALHAPAVRACFHNDDDWGHLVTAVDITGGDWTWFRERFLSDVGNATLRILPYYTWALNYLVAGFAPEAFYATNLLLHLALTACVWGLARRLTGPWGALLAAAVFGFNGVTGQGVHFLASREDQLATLAYVAACCLWPRARRSGVALGGVALLYLAGCFSKPTALSLPAALLLLDLLELGRAEALRPRRLLRLYAPLAALGAAWLALLTAIQGGGVAGNFPALRVTPLEAALTFAERLGVALLAPLTGVDGAMEAIALDLLRALALGACVLAGLRAGGVSKAVVAAAGAWLALNLVAPAPFLAAPEFEMRDHGRYFLLPSVGFALALAAFAHAAGRPRLAGAAALTCALAFGLGNTPHLGDEGSDARALLDALRAQPPERLAQGPVYVAVRRPSTSLVTLANSEAWRYLLPTAAAPPRVFLEGSRGLYEGTFVAPFGDKSGIKRVRDDFSLDADADAARALVMRDVFAAGGAPSPRFEPVTQPSRRALGATARDALPDWDLRPSPAGFVFTGPRAESAHRAGAGLQLHPADTLEAGMLTLIFGESAERFPAWLASPPLDLDPRAACRLEIDLVAQPHDPGPPRVAPLGVARFGLLAWSAGEALEPPFAEHLVVPLRADGRAETALVHLDNSPAWRATPRVRRLGFVPLDRPGEVTVAALRLRPCE